MKVRRNVEGIYKIKVDGYNSYYQQMRLLGKANEALSFDE